MNGGKKFLIQVLAACVVLSACALPAFCQAAASPPARTADQRKQDDIDRVMEFFRLTQPDVFDQAQALRGSNPARFDRLIMGALPTVNRLEALRRKSQELFDLSIQDLQLGYQSLRIAQRLKRTDLSDADRAKLTEQLKSVVAAEFVVQQQIRQLEINDLQQKVQDLDSQVKGREMDQENIIQKRVKDLVEKSPRLEW
jgi:hypothetical protein